MVIRYFLFTLLALMSFSIPVKAQTATFTASVNTQQVEYGKPLTLMLQATGLSTDLNSLDLSPLRKNFGYEITANVLSSSTNTQQIKLALYARFTGKLEIPTLQLSNKRTRPIDIQVSPALSQKSKQPVNIEFERLPAKAWIHEPVTFLARIKTTQHYVDLNHKNPVTNDYALTPLPQVKQVVNNLTHHQYGWVVYPEKTGSLLLELPAFQFKEEGIITHQFYPPLQTIDVQALPVFIPPTMAIGTVKHSISLPGDYWLSTRQLAFLELNVEHRHNPDNYIDTALNQFNSNNSVYFYKPELVDGSRHTSADGIHHAQYKIPFIARQNGVLNLPQLTSQYFDPDKGKIVTLETSTGRMVILPGWLIILSSIILLLPAYWLILLIFTYTRLKVNLYYNYKKIRNNLVKAIDGQEIFNQIKNISSCEGWEHNSSLHSWLSNWQSRYSLSPSQVESIYTFESQYYGEHPGSIKDVQKILLELVYQRLPLLKLF